MCQLLEGGAGNYYGSEITEKLEIMNDEEKAHILMEPIYPESVKV